MIALAIAVLEFISGLISALLSRLGRKTHRENAWKSEITYWAGRPRSIGGLFFGREWELKAISNSFKRLNVVVLSGGPGIGKSQLAAEFVQRSMSDGFWTQGAETAIRTIVALAAHLGIERYEQSDNELIFQIRRRLQSLPANTLWVIDDLPDLDQLNGLLNVTTKVSLLVTTRDGRGNLIPNGVDFYAVDVLDPESAVSLLRRNGHRDSQQAVFLEIVDAVGRLPRAVEALAVQLDSPGESPERLLEELMAAPNPLELDRFQTHTGGLQIPQAESLFNALRGSLDSLPSEVREAVSAFGYTANLPVPMPLVEALTGLSGGALVSFLEQCSRYSVLSVQGDQLTVHSLTSAVIAATNSAGSFQAALQRGNARLGIITGTRHLVPDIEIRHHERMLAWASQAPSDEQIGTLDFSNNLANAYDDIGHYDEAARLHRETLEDRLRVLGPEHSDTLTSRNNLALAYHELGMYQEAAELHRENLEAMQTALGPDHPTTLGNRDNLAVAYQELGRHEEAVQLHQQILETRTKVLGPEHPSTLGNQNNLALAYQKLGRYQEAADLHRDTLEAMERVMVPGDPDILMTRNNLAISYSRLGRLEEARDLFEGIVGWRETVLGTDHPDTLNSRNNLANIYLALGRQADALPLFEKTAGDIRRVLGSDHPSTLRILSNLGNCYASVGRSEDAINLLTEINATQRRLFGREHPETLNNLHNLAVGYREAGRFDESIKLFEEVLAVRARILGFEHPDTIASRESLAEISLADESAGHE